MFSNARSFAVVRPEGTLSLFVWKRTGRDDVTTGLGEHSVAPTDVQFRHNNRYIGRGRSRAVREATGRERARGFCMEDPTLWTHRALAASQ